MGRTRKVDRGRVSLGGGREPSPALGVHAMIGSAVIDGPYRYWLSRAWDEALPQLGACLLNPSKADGEKNDPTVRKLIGFAKRLGFGSLALANAFALRATDPREVKANLANAVGPRNYDFLEDICACSKQVLVGWGKPGEPGGWAHEQALETLQRLTFHSSNVVALKLTKHGAPGHPLYLSYELKPFPFPQLEMFA